MRNRVRGGSGRNREGTKDIDGRDRGRGSVIDLNRRRARGEGKGWVRMGGKEER